MLSQVTLLALASSALALQITSPGQNTIWDLSKTNEIKWNAVNTDPQTFDIYLSHMAAHPPSNTLLSANQNKDTGSFTIKDLQLPVGNTYQINFVAHDKPEQIYAQSQQFNTTGEAVAATSTLDGYVGPTYVPSGSAAGSSGSATKSNTDGSSTTRSSGTRTTLQVETGVSGSSTFTRTTTSVITGDASATPDAVASGSNSGSATSARPTATPNAAVVGSGASAPLAALVFGAAAFFL